MKQNGKRVLIIIILLLVILLCGIILKSCVTQEKTAKTNQTVVVKETKVEEVVEEVVEEDKVPVVPAKEEEVKEDFTEKKESNSNNQSTNKSSNETSVTNKNTTSNSHIHNWVANTTTVHHDEEGHYENVCVKEAWTEEIPVYGMVGISVCNTCGADITGNTTSHIKEHALKLEGGSCRVEYVQRQTGTEAVNHPAEYAQQWVVDKEAWDETITTYKCNCGATK